MPLVKNRGKHGGRFGLQIYQQSRLEKLETNVSLYIGIEVENNQIGEKGCWYLSKAAWRELEWIDLSLCFFDSAWNKIGDKGC